MIKTRALKALNLNQYNNLNKPEKIGKFQVNCPLERQYILRMLIKKPFEELQVPVDLLWCADLIIAAFKNQEKMGVRQPFCYITIRHGLVSSTLDDEWHVDGFSKTVTHLPEQNYCWSNVHPTDYVVKKIKFPKDFDTQKHNVHLFIQDNLNENDEVKKMEPKTLYCFDPYVIHRRPTGISNLNRTFVRITFIQSEINDVNNTINPLIKTNYNRDGKVEFRDKLLRYEIRSN